MLRTIVIEYIYAITPVNGNLGYMCFIIFKIKIVDKTCCSKCFELWYSRKTYLTTINSYRLSMLLAVGYIRSRQICHIAYSNVRFSICVYVCVFITFLITGRILTKIKNVKNNVYRFLDLPSNGAIANVILHDPDLLFTRLNVSNINISETVRASAKVHHWTFINFYIYHRITLLLVLYSVTLTFLKCLYFPSTGVIWECDLDLLFKVKHFKCLYLVNGYSYHNNAPYGFYRVAIE